MGLRSKGGPTRCYTGIGPMHNRNAANQLRRSSRVAAAVPILVTSLEPKIHFSEVCETLVISAHGCALRSRVKLEPGVPLHLHSKDGRETTAKVVSCHPIGSNSHAWRLGARLDRPENFGECANILGIGQSFPRTGRLSPLLRVRRRPPLRRCANSPAATSLPHPAITAAQSRTIICGG